MNSIPDVFGNYFVNATDNDLKGLIQITQDKLAQRELVKQAMTNLPDEVAKELLKRGKAFLKLLDAQQVKDIKVTFKIEVCAVPTPDGLIALDDDISSIEDLEESTDILYYAVNQSPSTKNSFKRLQKAYTELFKYIKRIAKKYNKPVRDVLVEAGLDSNRVVPNWNVVDIQNILKD